MKRCRRNIPLEICFVETLVVSGFNYFRRRSFIQYMYMYEGKQDFSGFSASCPGAKQPVTDPEAFTDRKTRGRLREK